MNMKHRIITLFVAVNLLVVAFLFVSCAASEDPTWSYTLTYDIVTDDNQAVLKVTAESSSLLSMIAPRSLKFILSDPERNTVDTGYISKDDLEDDKETIYIDMAKGYDQPKPGTYLLVVTSSGDIIYRTTLTFTGARLEIEKVLCTVPKYSESFEIRKLIITVRNTGDLPAIIHDGVLRIGGVEDDFLVLVSQQLSF